MIGDLDQRVTFQSKTATADGIGGQTWAWGSVTENATVWAKVFTARASEGMTEGRMAASATVVFTVRNRTDIDELHRIMWDGVPYNIRSVKRASWRDQYLTIEAERGVTS